MRTIVNIGLLLMVCILMVGCFGLTKYDYTTAEFEEALNNGENVEGKKVKVEVVEMEPNSAFGYNMKAGEYLNFVSAVNPKTEAGDVKVVTVDRVASMFGSFIITYTE